MGIQWGMWILQIVIVLLVLINIAYWKYSGIKSFWDKLLGIPFLTVAAGTPIIFTSLTRSVFEVSKLLNLRLALIWIVAVVLMRAIITKQKIQLIKTPLNWALLAYGIATVFSTIFSDNQYIAILGAYDRWDGLVTEFNYILFIWFYINFVKEKKTIYWLLGALLVGSAASAVYGVCQFFGLDFMNWSVNPQARVFACINNPVHYSPYIISHIPLLAGLTFFLIYHFKISSLVIPQTEWKYVWTNPEYKAKAIVWFLFFCLILMHYSGNYLSFGRAAWVGFSLAASYFLCFIYQKDTKTYIFDTFFIAMANLAFNAWYVFQIYTMSGLARLLFFAFILFFVLLFLINIKEWRKYVLYTVLVLFAGWIQFTISDPVILVIEILLILGLQKYFVVTDMYGSEKLLRQLFTWMLILIVAIAGYRSVYAAAIIKVEVVKASMGKKLSAVEKSQLVNQEAAKISILTPGDRNAINRTHGYASAFASGTARTSMWKSGLVWWLDGPRNFLLGTGPGTIKEFYPVYRRTDYGRLEGGHNFTPDQLHNDYVNMFASRGLLGVLTYFGWLLPLGMFMMIKKVRDEGLKAGNFILLGLFAGLFVHLGQTMFNFGVVATRILFYEFFCLGLVIVLYDPFRTKDNTQG